MTIRIETYKTMIKELTFCNWAVLYRLRTIFNKGQKSNDINVKYRNALAVARQEIDSFSVALKLSEIHGLMEDVKILKMVPDYAVLSAAIEIANDAKLNGFGEKPFGTTKTNENILNALLAIRPFW